MNMAHSPLALALLLTAACAASEALKSALPSHTTPPPVQWSGSEVGARFFENADTHMTMRVVYNTQSPKISIVANDLDDEGRTGRASRTYAVRYWPTAVCEVDSGVLLVAGKSRRNGCALIDIWRFASPVFSKTPASGPVTLECGALTDIDEVYTDPKSEHELVRKAVRQFGPHPAALVQFADSRDVYSIAPTTGELTLVASPSETTSRSGQAFHAPLLATTDFADSGEQAQAGYIYGFSLSTPPASGPSRVVLRDADEDGRIETVEVLSEAEWTARGWNDAKTWVR